MQIVYMQNNVLKSKPVIDRKWYGLIWAVLVVASLLRHIVAIVGGIENVAAGGAGQITLEILYALVFQGGIPALLCYFCAVIMVSMTWRRGIVYCQRNDFVYLAMIFTAAARCVMGIIDSLSFVAPVINTYTTFILDVTVHTAVMFALFFAVLKPKFLKDDRAAFQVFSQYSLIYMVFQGLNTIIPAAMFLMLGSGSQFSEELLEMLEQSGYTFMLDENVRYACIAALVIYFAWVIVCAVVALVMQNRAKKYVPPAAPPSDDGGNDGENGGSPFEDMPSAGNVGTDGNDKVFEEFDI